MRNEILRFHHISCSIGGMTVLDDVSFQVFEGEIYGILLLERIGSRELLEMVGKNIQVERGRVCFREKVVLDPETRGWRMGDAAVIGINSRLIDTLTVADNIFVINPGKCPFCIREKKTESRARELAMKYGLSLDPSRPACQLSDYERVMTELLRAMVSGSRLIVLRDIPDLFGGRELAEFHRFLRCLTEEGFTFLYCYNHRQVLSLLCDRVAVFKGCRVEMVLDRGPELEKNIGILEKSCLQELQAVEKSPCPETEKPEPAVGLSHVQYGELTDLTMEIYPGEVLMVLDQNNGALRDMMELFLEIGRTGDVPGVTCRKKIRIQAVEQDPMRTMLFWERSVEENLCCLMADRRPRMWYRRRIRKHIMDRFRQELGCIVDENDLYGLHSAELYSVIYYRILAAKPDLVVCMQPLAGRDLYLSTHILRLITKLSGANIPVLLLTSNLFDTIFVADRVLRIENGKICSGIPGENG